MTKNFKVTDDLLVSNVQRVLHNLVDSIIVYAIILSIPGLAGYFAIPPSQQGKLLPEIPPADQMRQIIILLTGILIYSNLMEIFFSKTIGKFITGAVVVMEDGSRPDTNTILMRSLCRMIPFDNFSFLFNPRRGWHDSLSKTYVVNQKALENAMRPSHNEDSSESE